jgi:hypothetical protein
MATALTPGATIECNFSNLRASYTFTMPSAPAVTKQLQREKIDNRRGKRERRKNKEKRNNEKEKIKKIKRKKKRKAKERKKETKGKGRDHEGHTFLRE